MRSARGDDENRRDRSPYFSNRSLQAMQDLESKRGRTLAGSPSPGALRTASLMGEGRRPGEYASDIPHAMTANLAVSDREDCDRWGAGPPKWAVPFSCIVASRMVTEAAVLQALRAVHDPESQQDIVTLGLVRDIAITEGGVTFTLAFSTQAPAAKAALHGQATKAVRQLPGVSHVQATMGRAGAAPAAQTHGHQHGAGPAAALMTMRLCRRCATRSPCRPARVVSASPRWR